jgi:hypothetical protein
MVELANEERETHLNMTGDNRGLWVCFSDDPVMMKKLDAVALFVEAIGQGKEYHLRADQLSFRKGKRQLSDERKAQLAARMRSLRKNTVTTVSE